MVSLAPPLVLAWPQFGSELFQCGPGWRCGGKGGNEEAAARKHKEAFRRRPSHGTQANCARTALSRELNRHETNLLSVHATPFFFARAVNKSTNVYVTSGFLSVGGGGEGGEGAYRNDAASHAKKNCLQSVLLLTTNSFKWTVEQRQQPWNVTKQEYCVERDIVKKVFQGFPREGSRMP